MSAPETTAPGTPLAPGATLGFVGLGNMGLPMVGRLLAAGYAVRVYDTVTAALQRAQEAGAVAVPEVGQVAQGADAIILMLPSSDVVEAVLRGGGLLGALAAGSLVVDMGSSRPLSTRALAAEAAERGVGYVDAPVSGGVKGAVGGSLTVMVGGADADVARVRPVLEELGERVLHLGAPGAGDALKALNNLMSAAHLLVTSEAMLAGQEFGLDPAVMLEAVNGSSGRSGSTQNKWPNFVLPGTYDSGFGLRLMLKDMRIAVELAESTGSPSTFSRSAVQAWAAAADHLPADADHTEIVRWLTSGAAESAPATAAAPA